jgi:hypothetical protein
LIREILAKKWTYKFPLPDWYKKVESIVINAELRNNVIWVKSNDRCLPYFPSSLRKDFLYSAQGDRALWCAKVKKMCHGLPLVVK